MNSETISSTWRNPSGWLFKVTNSSYRPQSGARYYNVEFIQPMCWPLPPVSVGTMRNIGTPRGRVVGVNDRMSDDELAVRGAVGFASNHPKEAGYTAEDLNEPDKLEWAAINASIQDGFVFKLNDQADDPDWDCDIGYAVLLESVDE